MLQRYFLPEKRRNYISPILATLHWLPVKFRIDFKIAVFVYKAVTPKYISDLLIPYSPQRALRSSNQLLLTVPCCRCKTEKGRRSFSSAAPILWNSLPVNVRFAPSPVLNQLLNHICFLWLLIKISLRVLFWSFLIAFYLMCLYFVHCMFSFNAFLYMLNVLLYITLAQLNFDLILKNIC